MPSFFSFCRNKSYVLHERLRIYYKWYYCSFFSVISVMFFGNIQTSTGGKGEEDHQPPSSSSSNPGWASMAGPGQEESQSLERNATDCAVKTKKTPGSELLSRTFLHTQKWTCPVIEMSLSFSSFALHTHTQKKTHTQTSKQYNWNWFPPFEHLCTLKVRKH